MTDATSQAGPSQESSGDDMDAMATLAMQVGSVIGSPDIFNCLDSAAIIVAKANSGRVLTPAQRADAIIETLFTAIALKQDPAISPGQLAEHIRQAAKVPPPPTGEVTVVTVPPSPLLERYFQALAGRAEAIRIVPAADGDFAARSRPALWDLVSRNQHVGGCDEQ
jgi:hypothetical protein